MSEARKGSAPKTTTERVKAMRDARKALGLKRRELYAHDDDWLKIEVFAMRLGHKRAASKRTKPRE